LRARITATGVAVSAGAALFALLLAADLVGQVTGCGSVDPTDPNNYSTLSIVNDTRGSVIVDHCSGAYCAPDDLPRRLSRGARYTGAHAACGVSGGDMTSWRVTTDRGKLLGFIAVDTPRRHEGLVFRVSRATSDPRTPTPAG
jgi:hypothetical protein